MNTKIIIADDHQIVRQGLRSLLEKEHTIQIIGESNNGRTTVQLAKQLKPDLIVMDLTMPDLNGIEATKQIVAAAPNVKVLALSMHSDKRFITGVLNAGASGYLLKDCASDELIQAIRAVVKGQCYLSPEIANIVVSDYRVQTRDKGSVSSSLTNRELEILQLIAEGKSTKQIASTLNLSIKTIETHRNQIMMKLNIHSVAGLTKYAIREGLSPL